ncbi:MAG TPA: hypothetical protein VGB81_13785 [Devosia sp.]
MTSIAKSLAGPLHHLPWPRLRMIWIKRKRRQTTVDLIHSSPHLLRDIGLTDGNISHRGR